MKSFRKTDSAGADDSGDGGLFKGSRHAVHVSESSVRVTRTELRLRISPCLILNRRGD